MKTKCIICEGRGCVPLGFYETCEELDRSKIEECKACDGRGFEYELTIMPMATGTIPMGEQPWIEPNPWQNPQQPPWWTYTTWISNGLRTTSGGGGQEHGVYFDNRQSIVGEFNIFNEEKPFGAGLDDA